MIPNVSENFNKSCTNYAKNDYKVCFKNTIVLALMGQERAYRKAAEIMPSGLDLP